MSKRDETADIVPQQYPFREVPVISREKILEIRERVRARYESELTKASWWKKFAIRWKMTREFRQEMKKMQPSPHSLYATKEIEL